MATLAFLKVNFESDSLENYNEAQYDQTYHEKWRDW